MQAAKCKGSLRRCLQEQPISGSVPGQELPGVSSVSAAGACGHGEGEEGFWYEN